MDDPIEIEQMGILREILGEDFTEEVIQGFRIVGPRFVDEFGAVRVDELRTIFMTHTAEGRSSLRRSLEHVHKVLGTFETFEARFPVTVIPPRPIFPLIKILGIETYLSQVYRVLHSGTLIRGTGETIVKYVIRTGRLPPVPRPRTLARRHKLRRVHWCSYRKWDTPEQTQTALQIFPYWSDCQLRATIAARSIKNSSYVAYNGDTVDPKGELHGFVGYYFEPLAQDHPLLTGGGPQICVVGAPKVKILERWESSTNNWVTVWQR